MILCNFVSRREYGARPDYARALVHNGVAIHCPRNGVTMLGCVCAERGSLGLRRC